MTTEFWTGVALFVGMGVYGLFRATKAPAPAPEPVDVDYMIRAYGRSVPPHIRARMAQADSEDEAKGELMDWIADMVRANWSKGDRAAAEQIRDGGFRVISAYAARRMK